MRNIAKITGLTFMVMALMVGIAGAASTGITGTATVAAPTCAIGIYPGSYVTGGTGGSSSSIDFGTLVAGQTVTPGGTDSPTITVYNDSTTVTTSLGTTVGVPTGITISGSDWSTWGSGSVSDTSVALTAYDSAATDGYSGAPAPFSLTNSQSSLILNMGPAGSGYGTLAFGVAVPSSASIGAATQTITVGTTC